MSYYFWLGRESPIGELHEAASDALVDWAKDDLKQAMTDRLNELVEHQARCKPEADGFITVYPKVK